MNRFQTHAGGTRFVWVVFFPEIYVQVPPYPRVQPSWETGSLKMQSSLRRSRTGVGQSLNSMTGVLVGRERCEERHRAGDWRVRPRHGDARGCRSRQMPGEARRNSPRASPQARAPADPLISDSGLWNRVRVSFRCFKSSILWSFALAALGNQYEVVRKNSVF